MAKKEADSTKRPDINLGKIAPGEIEAKMAIAEKAKIEPRSAMGSGTRSYILKK